MKHIYLLLVALVLSTSIFSQTEFWGTIRTGGNSNGGLIFKSDGNGENLTEKYNFPAHNSDYIPFFPSKKMLLASNGKFYGISGYQFGNCFTSCIQGGIYEFDPNTSSSTHCVIHGCVDLILSNNDILYGVGQAEAGQFSSIFQYDITKKEFRNLIDIDFGIGLSNNIILGSDGKIYGTTQNRGAYNYGVLFQYDLSTNKFTIIHDFTKPIEGTLVEGLDHNIYIARHYFYKRFDNSIDQKLEIFKYNLNNQEFLYINLPTEGFITENNFGGPYTEPIKLIESSYGVFYGIVSSWGKIIKFESTTNQITVVHAFEDLIDRQTEFNLKANNGKIYGISPKPNTKGVIEFDPQTNQVKNTFQLGNEYISENNALIELPIPTQLSAPYRNITLEKIFSPIACDAVVGATNYTWRFTSGTEVITYETNTASNILNPAEAGIIFNTQYSVEVKAKINNTWGMYGSAFQITTPQTIPTSKLQTAYCGITIKALTESIKCVATSGATQYEYSFIDNVSGKTIIIKNLSSLRLDKIAALEYGKTYTVTVRPVFYNSYGNSDGSCTITTPATIPPTRLSEAYRNTTLTALNNTIYCDKLPCVSDYQWEVTDAVTGKGIVKLRGNSSNSFQLSMINGIDYGRTYKIRIKGVSGTLKGDYAESFTIYTPTQIPTTSLQEKYCNKTFSSPNDILVCNTVLGATNYEWEVKNTTTGMINTVLKGSSSTTMTLATIIPVEYNTYYEIRVRAKTNTKTGSYGSICTVIYSGTTLTSKYCGITLTALNQSVFCTQIPNAIGYEWEVTSPTGAIYTKRFNTSTSYFVKFNAIFTPEYGKTYQVRIKPIFSTGDGEFGSTCSLTTPEFPTISLIESDCGKEYTSLEQSISCTPVIGAIGYEWVFNNTRDYYLIYTSSSPSIKASEIYNISFRTNIIIRVRAITDTQSGDFGSTCEVTMPSSLKSGTEFNETEEILSAENKFNSSDEKIVTTTINNEVASLFPNPAINEINIEVGNIETNYTAYIVDVKGSQVSKNQPLTQKVTSINISQLEKGFYFVKLSSDTKESLLLKFIKE
ncbi:MAG: T9SS type A sorting domain-containing protein [Bacteroidales bacterium]|nr:T9SS type A sorting domain-containing protein [Bacteroidales bacterium]